MSDFRCPVLMLPNKRKLSCAFVSAFVFLIDDFPTLMCKGKVGGAVVVRRVVAMGTGFSGLAFDACIIQ